MNTKNARIIVLLSLSTFLLPAMNPLHAQPVRVMTYNIRLDNPADGLNAWSNRKEFLIEQIKKANPDIIGVQESLPNQVTYLASALSDYEKVGVGRDENGQGESTTIFFRKKRFELKEHHQFWLSETPDSLSKGWDAAIRRICTYALLYDKQAKLSCWIFNTHFDHVGSVARLKSAELILKKISEANTAGLPVVLMGDFNATPESAPIQKLGVDLRDARLIAMKRMAGPEGSFNAFDSSHLAQALIDHVFVSPHITVKEYSVLVESRESRYPSDHFPVLVEVSWPDRSH